MKLCGIIPAMATPMKEDGSIDADAIGSLTNALIQNGADAIFATGSMGEAASLSLEDRLLVIRETVTAADGRVPVLAGTGFVTTKETVRATVACENLGVAAVSVISPFYWKLSQDDLYAHYAEVIRSTSLPVFAYNLPSYTGLNLNPETIGRLYREAGLHGAKDSSAVWENTRGYMDCTGADFNMLVGEDSLCLKGLEYGSCGSISAPANIYTYVMKAIYTRFHSGDIAGAQQAQADWNAIVSRLASIGSFPGNFKLATDRLVAHAGTPRLPARPGDPAKLAAVMDEVERLADGYRPSSFQRTLNLNAPNLENLEGKRS